MNTLFAYCLARNTKYPMTIARFLGRMVAEEKSRAERPDAAEEVSIWEHLDKMQYMDITENDADREEAKLVIDVLAAIQPGFDECGLRGGQGLKGFNT